MSTLELWRRASPDWGAWLGALDVIFRKQRLYVALLEDKTYQGYLRIKLDGGFVVEGVRPPEGMLRLASAVERLDGMALGEYVAQVAVPGAGFDPTRYLGFVACGREPDWERFRMQACMRVATEIITGTLPEELRPAFLSIGRTKRSPVMFGGAVFAPFGRLDAILEYMNFRGYNADDRSGIIAWTPRRLKKEVILVGARA